MLRTYDITHGSRLHELKGAPLASFLRRGAAFLVDCMLVIIGLLLAFILVGFVAWKLSDAGGGTYRFRFEKESWYGHLILNVLVPILYFGLFTYFWNGQTPGKRLFHIRVVSLTHRHITLWHSIERCLGYVAASLEFGFGFLQYFIHPNRQTVQDRLAETIVIDEKKAHSTD